MFALEGGKWEIKLFLIKAKYISYAVLMSNGLHLCMYMYSYIYIYIYKLPQNELLMRFQKPCFHDCFCVASVTLAIYPCNSMVFCFTGYIDLMLQ